MIEIQKLRAERQIADALNIRNRPKTDAVHDLLLNSPVLIWREGNTDQAGHWDRLYNLLTVEGEIYTVKLLNGPTSFQSTVVKPYLRSKSLKTDPEINPKPQESKTNRTAQPPLEPPLQLLQPK